MTFNLQAWIGKPWTSDYTCLDFAVAVSNAITGLSTRNPERDPEVVAMLAHCELPSTILGAEILAAHHALAEPGDIWLLRSPQDAEGQPLHACTVVDRHHGSATMDTARVLELSHNAMSRVLRMKAVARFAIARYRPTP